jgi:hypothetical protein
VSFAQERPTLVLNPPDDRDFGAAVDSEVGDDVASPEELQSRLRRAYPRAIVRRRELAGEPAQIWYVYRDGHWIGRPHPERAPPGEE